MFWFVVVFAFVALSGTRLARLISTLTTALVKIVVLAVLYVVWKVTESQFFFWGVILTIGLIIGTSPLAGRIFDKVRPRKS